MVGVTIDLMQVYLQLRRAEEARNLMESVFLWPKTLGIDYFYEIANRVQSELGQKLSVANGYD